MILRFWRLQNSRYVYFSHQYSIFINEVQQPNKKPKTEHIDVKKHDPEPGPSNHPQPGPSNQPQNSRDKYARLSARARQLRSEVGARSELGYAQAEAKETRELDYRLASRLSQIINEYQDLVRDQICTSALPSGSLSTFQAAADKFHKDARDFRRRLQGLKDRNMSHEHRWDLMAEFEGLLKDLEDLSDEIMGSLETNNGGES